MKTNKILSLIAALALTAGTSITPILATGETSTDASFTKTYKIENEGTTSPKETFTFKIVADKVEETSTVTKDQMPMIGGQLSTLEEKDIKKTRAVGDGDDSESAGYVTVDYAKGAATVAGKNETVALQSYLEKVTWPGVGVYYYKVTEVAGTTAGVEYDNAVAYLKVTVANKLDENGNPDGTYYVSFVTLSLDDKLNNETGVEVEGSDGITDEKTGGFTNIYKAAKTVEITKEVTGNLGDTSEYFEVYVTLTNPSGKDAPTSYTTNGASLSYKKNDVTNPTSIEAGKKTTFYIKHGETIKIENVPYGVTYSVSEKNYEDEDYKTKYTATSGVDDADTEADESNSAGEYKANAAVTVDAGTETVTITNKKGITIDTGIFTNSTPYIAMAGIVAVIAVAFVIRRKRVKE